VKYAVVDVGKPHVSMRHVIRMDKVIQTNQYINMLRLILHDLKYIDFHPLTTKRKKEPNRKAVRSIY
jgi:hypothetical protein